MKGRMKALKGSSLPAVMVICVLISLLVLFAFALFDMNNLFYSNYQIQKQRKEDMNSAFVLYCNDSTLLGSFDEADGYKLYQDAPGSVFHYQIRSWGLYERVTVRTSDGTYSSTRLLGKVKECEYEAALWVCSRNMVLSLAGDTRVKGQTFIPMNGISYIQLGDTPFRGREIEDEYIDLADEELPAIDTSVAETIRQLREGRGGNAFPTEEQKPYYSFRNPTGHFDWPGASGQLFIKGNVVLHGDEITLSAGSVLSDVILVGRKVIVEEGFVGSLQIVASDTVIVKANVQLRYPSGVYLEGNEKKTYLSIGSHSQINGYAIVFGDAEQSSGIYVEENYRQDSTASVRGLLYVDGMADVRGEVSGAAYLKECYYLPENGVYAGTIKDARISRNEWIGFPLFFKDSGYRRKEMKTLH